MTIQVDDDAAMRILAGVAERCGGTVKVALVTRLEIMVSSRKAASHHAADPAGTPAAGDRAIASAR